NNRNDRSFVHETIEHLVHLCVAFETPRREVFELPTWCSFSACRQSRNAPKATRSLQHAGGSSVNIARNWLEKSDLANRLLYVTV
ncbi:hypothetical protein MRX96_051926, partial [Rhipicephalus microplus]